MARPLPADLAALLKHLPLPHLGPRPLEEAISSAGGIARAALTEALELRAAGITQPILLLEGFFEASELALIDQHQLWCVVHSLWQLDAIEQARLSRPLARTFHES